MGASKFLIFLVVLSSAFLGIWADAQIEDDATVVETEAPDSSLLIELEQLRSMISVLESSIAGRTQELKSKDDSIALMENAIEEKSESIASLQSEIESLQKKGAVDAAELVGKAHARAGELEKQIEKLKNEIQTQNHKRVALEARASEAEKKAEELNLKLESLQKTNEEQKRRLKKTERSLQVAQEELLKVQFEATSKNKEISEIHGAWLPPWLAAHVDHCQGSAAVHWKEHGKPAYDAFLQKVSHISAQAQKRFEPHIETAKTKWIPAIKEQWVAFSTFVEPYAHLVATKSVEVYEGSVTTLRPHIIRIQEIVDPYFQDAKKFSKPYVNQVATFTKPHVEKVRVVLKPYTKQVVTTYGMLSKSATTYHRQVQATVQETLKKHELTRDLATEELVWFVASAVVALPIFFLYGLFPSIFCKKPRKPIQSAHANHTHRRHKRRHTDK